MKIHEGSLLCVFPLIAILATNLREAVPHGDFKKWVLSRWGAFVNDFVIMGQGTGKQLTNSRPILLHTFHEVFCRLKADDSPSPKEPASSNQVTGRRFSIPSSGLRNMSRPRCGSKSQANFVPCQSLPSQRVEGSSVSCTRGPSPPRTWCKDLPLTRSA